MAEDVDKDSKTEEATEKKIRDTVEKGQLPHSRETGILASFVAILLFIVFFAGNSIMELGTFLSVFLEKPDAWPMGTANDVVALSRIVTLEIGKAVVEPAGAAGRGRRRRVGVPEPAAVRRRAHPPAGVAHLDLEGLEAAVRRAGLRRVPEVARQARLRRRRAHLRAVRQPAAVPRRAC